ncbi:Beta-barrel assembly-enhancing protease [Methylophilaceae bacterium]|nr:Beta-barrel assembly-enhancing protease [Methylophilaceae bacterium]
MSRIRLFTFVALSIFFLSGCGTNPVTKKREIQFVSEQQEIAIGQQNYAPTRQSQGGDYVIDPELTAYVQGIGKRLAAASDRPLPYEFIVLNNSVPNAWAMPGGKIAFNRGLLYELNSEAELAAVMGHEIVHSAARHGAQSMERGVLLQGAIMAIGIGAQNSNYGNLIVGGSQLGAQLVSSKYGRDAESESDYYGMLYMKKAGYDPAAAVSLQETFVRLSEGKQTNFLEGLFASHPPSQARVEANRATLAKIGAGGEWGKEIYAQKVGKLKATQAAYKAHDEGVAALAKGDTAKAAELAKKAIAGEPREARFQDLLGDIALSQKKYDEALKYYAQAIKMQPDYFKPHIQSGIALYNSGRKAEAEPYFKRSNELLPTAPGHYFLGEIAESRGDMDNALKNYQIAADSNSEIGKASTERYVRIDLPKNPGKYLKTAAQVDNRGYLYAVVQNPTPVTVSRVQIRVVRYDANTGKAIGQSRPLLITSGIEPNKQGNVQVQGARLESPEETRLYRVVVESAQLAN